MSKAVDKVITELLPTFNADMEKGRYEVSPSVYYMVQEYETKKHEDCRFESHKRYADIQYILKGEEIIETAPVKELKESTPYSEQKDITFFEAAKGTEHLLKAGDYLVFYPEDGHKPGMRVDNAKPEAVKKVVVKILLENE